MLWNAGENAGFTTGTPWIGINPNHTEVNALGDTRLLVIANLLFGAADPSFDGVYRQGLAITGLRAVKARVPASAVMWLAGQQCPNGGFQAYLAKTSAPCDAPGPATYSGPDSNSTALAAMALLLGFAAPSRQPGPPRTWARCRTLTGASPTTPPTP